MATASPPSRDVALETVVFWERFKKPIIVALSIALLAVIVFTAYRFYADRRAAAASAVLASAKSALEYQQVITHYSSTPAAADAYILLAEAQRKEKKFEEANKTLETFIAKYPTHELLSTAKMALAANLESMGKADEALAMYQQIASAYPNGYAAPLAMLSQVYILKAKNRNDDARRICETILTQYPNEPLGWRSDAAIAFAKTNYRIHAGTDSSANCPADVGGSCRARAASSARAKSAAGRAVAKETVDGRARPLGAPRTRGKGRLGDPSLPLVGRGGIGDYRFENWNRFRAPGCPDFFRSFIRGSRRSKPSALSGARKFASTWRSARAIANCAAPACPIMPPPLA